MSGSSFTSAGRVVHFATMTIVANGQQAAIVHHRVLAAVVVVYACCLAGFFYCIKTRGQAPSDPYYP